MHLEVIISNTVFIWITICKQEIYYVLFGLQPGNGYVNLYSSGLLSVSVLMSNVCKAGSP